MPGYCKSKGAIGLERLSYDSEWLIGDVFLSSEYRSSEECDECPIQDIEMVLKFPTFNNF